MQMSYEVKLKEMGYTLETIELNTGRFFHAVQTGNLIFTSVRFQLGAMM